MITPESQLVHAFSGDDGAGATGDNRSEAWTTLWLQIPTSSSSTIGGATALAGRAFDGRSLSIGAAAIVGSGKGGIYLFAANTFVDESVDFEADGRAASGTLTGSEYSIGAGFGRTFGGRLTLSTGFRQSFSELEFERTLQVGTPNFPESRSVTDTLERRKRTAWLVGASLRVLGKVHLDAQASYRDEAVVSLALSVGF